MIRLKHALLTLLLTLCTAPALSLASEQAVTIHIEGMTCSLCVTAINQSLRSLPDVHQAKTSLPRQEAVVIVPEGYAVGTLLAAIEDTGYKGEVRSVKTLADK